MLVQLHESTDVKERYIWCDDKYTEIIFNHTQINIIITTLLQFISCVVCVLIVVFNLKIMNVLRYERKWDVKENQERKYFNDISIQYVAHRCFQSSYSISFDYFIFLQYYSLTRLDSLTRTMTLNNASLIAFSTSLRLLLDMLL